MPEYFREVDVSEPLRTCPAVDPIAMHKMAKAQPEMPTLIDTSALRNDWGTGRVQRS
jgi:hypothetical protein